MGHGVLKHYGIVVVNSKEMLAMETAMDNLTIREYETGDLDAMIAVWNEIVESGDAFTSALDFRNSARFHAASA